MKMYIGMTMEEARQLYAPGDITTEQDMENGYYWIWGQITLFGEKISANMCFLNGKLWMVDLSPHFSVEKERPPFSIDMEDYEYDKAWVKKHKKELPLSAAAYYEPRTPSVGVCIK